MFQTESSSRFFIVLGVVKSPGCLRFNRCVFILQKKLREYCKTHGIQVEAYSSFGSGHLFTHEPVVQACGGLDVATCLLRWALQQVCFPSFNSDFMSSTCP